MSLKRGKSPGWAAFDLKQRQKHGLDPELDKEPYPPMPSSISSLHPCNSSLRNDDYSVGSFSSVLLPPSVDFPSFTDKRDCKKSILIGNSSGEHDNKFAGEDSHVRKYKKFKELHRWADNSLIVDIMTAMDNDIDKTSNLLKEMVSSGSFEENKEIVAELNSATEDFPHYNSLKANNGISLGKTTDVAVLSTNLEDSSSGRMLFGDTTADMKLILGNLRSIPVEPEWEEDDIYLIHRKDAIKMMRSASQHSKAAANAFSRGDHFSAQQHSLQAREEWLAAERLNAKAAKEILSIRNGKNDMWKLDLHGLHVAEAIQVLREHLQKIETQVPSVSPNTVSTTSGIVGSSSLESFSCMNMEMSDKQQLLSRHRPALLQVITGRGNHSRGPAALPTAVRNFLNENGYRFDETRPGMITVRPKFRLWILK